jgi:RIO-like serine/threonine protein kinase
MWAVVMDFIDCRLGKTRHLSAVHKEKLRTAVTSLHESGYVFGDLRWPNVLLPDDSNLHLVDFEWAGEEAGQARAPEFNL